MRAPEDAISHERKLAGLEKRYPDVCFKVSRAKCDFPDFFDPNEKNPIEVSPHCSSLEEGLAVVTGCERAFFLLCRLDPTTCLGLVGRDINPNAKCYFDFNVLLLRISSSREEYVKLSEKTKDEESFARRIQVIAAKLKVAPIPDKAKRYYQLHLEEFGSVYLNTSKQWREESSFDGCNYHKCDALFKKVKGFADAGNIISTTGPINDLMFLEGRPVSYVDTSNILAYSFINLKVLGNPRVIWTLFGSKGQGEYTVRYQSYVHQPLSDEDSAEFDALMEVIKSCVKPKHLSPHVNPFAFWLLDQTKNLANPFASSLGPIYSEATLNFLREFRRDNILTVPQLGHVNLGCSNDIKRLNILTPWQIQDLCSEARSWKFLKNLAGAWEDLNAEIYLEFSCIEGWKDAFEGYFSNFTYEFDECLQSLFKVGLYEKFENFFGKERLKRFADEVSNVNVFDWRCSR